MAIGTTGCAAYDPSQRTAYGYVPWLSAGIVYCVLFGLSMLVHVFQTFRTRAWWTIVFAVGALTELIGWAGRTWSAECPYNSNAFFIQICTLIIAPTFFTAGLYVILGRVIHIGGRKISPLSATTYLWIFCTIDVISLVLQAIGGALAAGAFNATPEGNTSIGTNIMVAGIDFQLASTIVFSCLYVVVLRRAIKVFSLPIFTRDPNMRYLLAVSCWCIILIILRSVYRTVELAEGWTGYVITTQRLFVAMDGAPMLTLVVSLNIFHPGALINRLSTTQVDNGDHDNERPKEHGDKNTNSVGLLFRFRKAQ